MGSRDSRFRDALRDGAARREVVERRLALLRADLARGRPEAAEAAYAEEWADQPAADGTTPWWAEHTSVPELRVVGPAEAPAPAAPPPEPPAGAGKPGAALVPQPGCHASRREAAPTPRDRASALLPETLRGRLALGPWQVAVVATVLAVGLAVACWWVVTHDARPVVAAPTSTAEPLVELSGSAPGAASASAAPSGGGTGAPGSTAASAGTVVVDVTGKVRRRGVLTLPAGSRVVDALKAAGGAKPGVDLSSLNLARPLVDGEQVVVGQPAQPTVGEATGAGSGGAPAPGALVNLNTATLAELETLPDVGPVTAQAILDWREAHGGFSAVEELLEVDGIGDATLEKLTPHVTV